jgi:16S rRNA (adenine1518-N6/adenine1519-N6)-dimethyltransferase
LLKETKECLRRCRIRLRKEVGQNFLVDDNVFRKIIECVKEEDVVLEIGSGIGTLTKEIAGLAKEVFACEIDPFLLLALKRNIKDTENVHILEEDILNIELSSLSPIPNKVIGNLPYYITTPIITHILGFKRFISSLIVMVQTEVAERILSRNSPLSLLIHLYTEPRVITKVSRSSFFPTPKVDSVLLEMIILQNPAVSLSDESLFFKIVDVAFSARRKAIKNSLAQIGVTARMLKKAGIDPKARPEHLSLSDFARIATALSRESENHTYRKVCSFQRIYPLPKE